MHLALHLSVQSGARGAPATCEGHFVAFGCTEESYARLVLGHAARGELDADGAPARAWCRLDGSGGLPAHDGDYADALSKRRTVHHLHMETTGAMNRTLTRLLTRLLTTVALAAKRPGADSTIYGSDRASYRSFLPSVGSGSLRVYCCERA